MNYIEIDFTVEPKEQGCDVLIAQLAEIEYESFTETEKGFCAYIPEIKFDESQLNIALSFCKDFFSFTYNSKIIPQQNWNKQWESNFEPIEIEDKCIIRAPFHTIVKKYLYEIVIEPKMSFGTGHHETTQLMIQKILHLELKNKTVLDMGCGTGVLSIAASMKGASLITAIDIDDWSIENTFENLERNNIHNVNVQKGNAQTLENKVFHTILANINKNVLLADIPVYFESMENSGNMILSGFFETDVTEITNRSSYFGFKLEDKMVSNQWTMLHFIK